ncbi:hypothetical protein GN316_01995 [Xylophilus sp. Kf1]|nr:hypothetical protein [Xylophilus sp. Kf1]
MHRPQALNNIPMVIGRQMHADAFCCMVLDNFEEMLLRSRQVDIWTATPGAICAHANIAA